MKKPTGGTVFRDADRVEGPTIDVTWEALVAAGHLRRKAMADGVLDAPMPEPEAKEAADAIAEGVLALQAPCGYCDLQSLCGRTFGVVG